MFQDIPLHLDARAEPTPADAMASIAAACADLGTGSVPVLLSH